MAVIVALDSVEVSWEALSDMARVGETRDWLMLGAAGALCDHAIDGGRPTWTEWLRPRPRLPLILDSGGTGSFMWGLGCAFEVDRRRRILSGALAAWNLVLIALREFLASL